MGNARVRLVRELEEAYQRLSAFQDANLRQANGKTPMASTQLEPPQAHQLYQLLEAVKTRQDALERYDRMHGDSV